MRVLVTGGAGYIGSHTAVHLVAAGHEPIIMDNFSNAKPTVLDRLAEITATRIQTYAFDLRNASDTDALFASEQIDAVIHFAGLKAVEESVANPLRYYENNLGCTFVLLEAMQRYNINILVFSSSATVYGNDAAVPMTEDAQTSATNPYGRTKVMIEEVLRDAAARQRPRSVALLRYFNPAGAHPSGLIGEDPLGPPNNLVPCIAQVAVGRRDRLLIFGDDYPTRDGTCLRDYIHVEDLAAGHVAALATLERTEAGVHTWNLGTGTGTSVLEMVQAFEKVVGHGLRHDIVGRRPGDIGVCYADPTRAIAELNWTAARTIEDMCADTWNWQSQNPDGYPAGPASA